jgi:CubicO group peptidase (beta-lactamase class C family)
MSGAVPGVETRAGIEGRDVIKGAAGARLDALLARLESYGLWGTFLIAKDDGIVLMKGYGFADQAREIRNSPDTLFEASSITKTFTAAAILRLEMEGKLKTSDPISKYLGEFPEPKSGATIYHLLAHKGGLIVEGVEFEDVGKDRDLFVQAVKQTPAEAPPGQKYRYTNAGYSVIAAIIEKVTGKPYESVIRDELLKPAGMTNTGFRGDFQRDDPRVAKGYLGAPERIREGPPLEYPWGTRGAGGMISTVGDLYKWHLALQGTAILSEPAKKKMFAPAPTEQYGWHVEKSSWGTTFIQKGGGQVNFASHVMFFPEDRLVVIFVSNNLQQRWRRFLLANVPAAALGKNYLLPPAITRIDSASMQRYEGAYVGTNGLKVSIRCNDGHLSIDGGGPAIPDGVLFFPQSERVFNGVDTANARLISLRFHVGSGGRVKGAVEFPAGRRVTLQKL